VGPHLLRQIGEAAPLPGAPHQGVHLRPGHALHLELDPGRDRMVAVLAEHQRLHLRPAHAQVGGRFAAEAQGVRPGPGTQDALRPPCCANTSTPSSTGLDWTTTTGEGPERAASASATSTNIR